MQGLSRKAASPYNLWNKSDLVELLTGLGKRPWAVLNFNKNELEERIRSQKRHAACLQKTCFPLVSASKALLQFLNIELNCEKEKEQKQGEEKWPKKKRNPLNSDAQCASC